MTNHRTWTDQEILDALVAHRQQHGRWPTSNDWKKSAPTHPSSVTLITRWDGWKNVIAAAEKHSGGEPKGPAVAPAEAEEPLASPTSPPVVQSPVAPPSPPAGTGEDGSLPEPPSEPAAAAAPIVEPPSRPDEAPSPSVNGDAPAGSEHAFEILDLLALIRDLDRRDIEGEDGYLELSRYTRDGSGETDRDATALVRRLARAALSTAPLADVGAAVLAQLDEAT